MEDLGFAYKKKVRLPEDIPDSDEVFHLKSYLLKEKSELNSDAEESKEDAEKEAEPESDTKKKTNEILEKIEEEKKEAKLKNIIQSQILNFV